MNRLNSVVALLLAALAIPIPSISRSQQTPPPLAPPSRTLQFRYVIHVPALPSQSHHARLWIPLPYEDSHQSISGLRIDAPVREELRREPLYNDRYAYFAFDPARQKTPFDVTVTF